MQGNGDAGVTYFVTITDIASIILEDPITGM
jgi:hypothetical protein